MVIKNRVCLFILFFLCILLAPRDIFARDLDPKAANPAKLDRQTKEIYLKLQNPRSQDPLLDCFYPEAREIKVYIEDLIKARTKEEDIFYEVAKKFTLGSIADQGLKAKIEQRILDETNAEHPLMVLENIEVKLGEQAKSQDIIRRSIKVSNKGNAPLIIKSVSSFCGCLVVSLKQNGKELQQATIPPGGTAEIELALDPKHASVSIGAMLKEAHLLSNDIFYPEVYLKIKADITG